MKTIRLFVPVHSLPASPQLLSMKLFFSCHVCFRSKHHIFYMFVELGNRFLHYSRHYISTRY